MAERITDPQRLREIAARARREMELREGRKQTQVTVHMGTCGIAAGARDVLAAFVREIAAAGLSDVSVHQSGCAGLCEQEPMATVTAADGSIYRYGLLDADKVRAIVNDHLVKGTPVAAYLIEC